MKCCNACILLKCTASTGVGIVGVGITGVGKAGASHYYSSLYKGRDPKMYVVVAKGKTLFCQYQEKYLHISSLPTSSIVANPKSGFTAGWSTVDTLLIGLRAVKLMC